LYKGILVEKIFEGIELKDLRRISARIISERE
jgi:hypothetical protein